LQRRLYFFITGFAAAAAILAITGALYWQSLKDSPQYSLAMLVDASRSDDETRVRSLVDTDAIVDDFVPQITAKAIELYGRGLPERTITRVGSVAAPLIPAVKQKARGEIPEMIRRETNGFADVPFAAMVLGASRYLQIETDGESASVSSKLPEHGFKVKMKKNAEGWQVVGVNDEELAEQIARAIGEQIIAAASGKAVNEESSGLRLSQINEMLRRAEDALR
jgi:hypothetical protein